MRPATPVSAAGRLQIKVGFSGPFVLNLE